MQSSGTAQKRAVHQFERWPPFPRPPMQFALVNDQRQQPQPRLRGECQVCGQEAISKCGSQKIWHWAHHGRRHCDPWWENETDWHRAWKARFPEAMREVVQFDEATGEKHVADVKTSRGLVIELQHSAMSAEELQSRERFYGNMIWIVDGRSFASRFEVRDGQLPHPKSALLQDVEFFHPHASVFWRRSEAIEGSSMAEMHRSAEIANEIMADYRGHHFFHWKRPHQVWMEATAPVFIDFGTEELVRLCRYSPPTQWCVQRIAARALVEKNGGTYLVSNDKG